MVRNFKATGEITMKNEQNESISKEEDDSTLKIKYISQVRYLYTKEMYDTIKKSPLSFITRLLKRDPIVKVSFNLIRRYYIDREGQEIPDSRTTLYLTSSRKNNEKSKQKRVSEFYKFDFCMKCDEVKPPRSHHCSVCGKCILKMDHHCPFIGNCIGLHN